MGGTRRWMVDRSVVWQKGGDRAARTLGAKLRHQIAHGAVAVTKLTGDVRERAALDEESTQGLVAAVQDLDGLAEKVLGLCVIHDRYSWVFMRFFVESGSGCYPKFVRADKAESRRRAVNS